MGSQLQLPICTVSLLNLRVPVLVVGPDDGPVVPYAERLRAL